jgi:hypothetical protein
VIVEPTEVERDASTRTVFPTTDVMVRTGVTIESTPE